MMRRTDRRFSLLWLRERFAWQGKYSGYDLLCNYLARLWQGGHRSVFRNQGPLTRRLEKYLMRLFRDVPKVFPFYNAASALAELKAAGTSLVFRPHLFHILYTEHSLGLFLAWRRRFPFKIIGTLHHPPALWEKWRADPKIMSSLDALIVLSRRDAAYFGSYFPGRVHFIPYAVDTEFFKPVKPDENGKEKGGHPRFVFCGFWLRDPGTLQEIISKVIAKDGRIRFDLVVPTFARKDPHFASLVRYRQVTWHSDLSDKGLRDVYCRARALVMPFLDCGASNALVEAIACGLPVLTNDVGGVPDYTHDSFAELFPVGEVDGMVEEIFRLAGDDQEVMKRGGAARAFALKNLSWEQTAHETLRVYHRVLNGS